jgi:hypothetical protein
MEVIGMTKSIISLEESMSKGREIKGLRLHGHFLEGIGYRRCEVGVRKDAPDKWVVYTSSFIDGKELASWDIVEFPCGTCAVAFRECVVFGDGDAECYTHAQGGFSDGDTYAARVAVLCCFFGLSEADFASLPLVSKSRLFKVAHLLSTGQLTWEKVARAIEAAEQLRSQLSLSWKETIDEFYREVKQIVV